jgi:DNA-binding NarL/FixJ family response regulator
MEDITFVGVDVHICKASAEREVKQRRPDLPVMMVTAYGDDEHRRRASELGAAGFLAKPVSKSNCGNCQRQRIKELTACRMSA